MIDEQPYTTADEDPFNVQPLLQQPRHRRSSMLNKWIQEQQKQPFTFNDFFNPTEDPSLLPPTTSAYLAYPTFGRAALHPDDTRDDIVSLNSYDLVEDDDIPQNLPGRSEMPSTPTATPSRRTSKLLQTPTSFRSFSRSFRSTSPAVSQSPPSGSSPRPSSRLSFFPRSPRDSICSSRQTPQQHNRSSSLSTLNSPQRQPITGSSKWRPSVMNHFAPSTPYQASIPLPDPLFAPARPSMSSGETYTSATATTMDTDVFLAPPKLSFMDSIRSRSGVLKSVTGSTISVWSPPPEKTRTRHTHEGPRSGISTPSDSETPYSLKNKANDTRVPFAPKLKSRLANSNIEGRDEDEDDEDEEAPPVKHDPARPHVAYPSGGTLPRVSFASLSGRGQKKKKKLVVSGVGSNEVRKFEGVKRWCESFGEVSQITRMPNGDLHVHFRRADVADTVCRLRAKVHISGVGSVQLSWYSGDKR